MIAINSQNEAHTIHSFSIVGNRLSEIKSDSNTNSNETMAKIVCTKSLFRILGPILLPLIDSAKICANYRWFDRETITMKKKTIAHIWFGMPSANGIDRNASQFVR